MGHVEKHFTTHQTHVTVFGEAIRKTFRVIRDGTPNVTFEVEEEWIVECQEQSPEQLTKQDGIQITPELLKTVVPNVAIILIEVHSQ